MAEQPRRRAAIVVYNISEIWRNVLSFMDLPTLGRVILVDKSKTRMAYVVKELWGYGNRSGVELAACKSAIEEKRRLLYKGAITTYRVDDRINLSLDTLLQTFKMPRADAHGTGCMDRRKHWLDEYRPADIPRMIKLLAVDRGYSGLREIRFGYYNHFYTIGENWVVIFDPRSTRHHRRGARPASFDHRIIEHSSTLRWNFSNPPPSTALPHAIAPPPEPTCDYTVRYRYNVTPPYTTGNIEARYSADWRLALQESPVFGKLHRELDLGVLPVTMTDIVKVCERQTEDGHRFTLEFISASHARHLTMNDFQRLSLLRLDSLVKLCLANVHSSERTRLTFSDIPLLLQYIRAGMPNLTSLRIAMNGVETAESVCRNFLTPNPLDRILRKPDCSIIVSTGPVTGPLFNVTRLLATFLNSVWIGGHSVTDSELWSEEKQTRFIKYLRDASPTRRKDLSNVDFSTIGVSTVEDLYALEIDDTALVVHPYQSEAKGWSEIAKRVRETSDALAPKMEMGALDLSRGCRRVEAMMVDDVPDSEKSTEAKKLLEAVKKVREVAAEAAKLLERDPGEEIERYIASLEAGL